MKTKSTILKTILMPSIAFLFFISIECMADISKDTYQILARHIIEYNSERIDSSSNNPDAYRGEEGVLLIRPDVAEKLGLKVYIDQDFHDSVRLNDEAEEALLLVKRAMEYQGKDKKEKTIHKNILLNMLVYREKSQLAKEKLTQYKGNIKKEVDERFNNEICTKTIIVLLKEGLNKTNHNLRDALGFFYNKCRGKDWDKDHITSENVQFVNHIFNNFIADASQSEISLFDIDRNIRNGEAYFGLWKAIVKEDFPDLLPYLESAVKKTGEAIYGTDPLLFLALIKRESAFDSEAVSSVGAAGLTQIMPDTARDLGLKNIYTPKYYFTAGDYLKKERNLKAEARNMPLKIRKKEDLQYAKKARELMLKAMEAGKKRAELYAKYKKDLINNKKDDRLDPSLAIKSGYRYFSRLMKSQKGDISLALAAYNAGARRVRQYKGLPPFDETLIFRNRVLQYYNEYLSRIR